MEGVSLRKSNEMEKPLKYNCFYVRLKQYERQFKNYSYI